MQSSSAESTHPPSSRWSTPEGAQNWGEDDLGAEELVEAGASRTWVLPAAIYDLLLEDCDGEVLAEEYGLDVAQALVFTLTD
jgi:hypothetical protein